MWTYYEATPQDRQHAIANALRDAAPEEFALMYEQGMRDWQDEAKIAALDAWMHAHDEAARAWLRVLLKTNREALLKLRPDPGLQAVKATVLSSMSPICSLRPLLPGPDIADGSLL